MATLATEGAKNSWMVLLAMAVLDGGKLHKKVASIVNEVFIEERDGTRSDPSQESLKIFLEVFRQVKSSHALLCCIEAWT